MADPLIFDTKSPRFGLPLLFSGQAQKEFFVNEAHALADALLHCAVEGIASAAPLSPVEGENWLVATDASGDWEGQDGKIACCQTGNWILIPPRDGLRVLNRSTGQELFYRGGWMTPAIPSEPIGGTTVDGESRAAISALIAALRDAGIFPAS